MSREIRVGNTPIKFAKIKSKRFLCSECLEFCIEHVPIIEKGMKQQFFARLREERNRAILAGRKPDFGFKVKLECPRGHHRSPHWSFRDITMVKRANRFKPR